MKLKNFITESYGIPLYEVVSAIHKDCQPFLKEFIYPQSTYTHFLYSGRSIGRPFDRRKMRTDRRTTDMSQVLSNDLDAAFQKRFGWPVRKASMFVTGSMYTALEYGKIFAIFPIGNYKYLWSPEIQDLYTHFSNITHNNVHKREDGSDINPLMKHFEMMAGVKSSITADFNNYYEKLYGTQSGNGHYEYLNHNYAMPLIKVPKGQPPEMYIRKMIKDYKRDNMIYDKVFLKWIPNMTYVEFNNKEYDNFRAKNEMSIQAKAKIMYDDKIDKILRTYTTKSLLRAVQMDREIMLHCDEYYAVAMGNGNPSHLKKWYHYNGIEMPPFDEIHNDFKGMEIV